MTTIQIVPHKWRCVFATQKYNKDDLIEICEYIHIPQDQIAILKKTVLNDYRFGRNWENDDAMLLLGNGSLYNHSKTPTMQLYIDNQKNVWFIATRDIDRGEELTIDYGYDLHFQDIWDCQIVKHISQNL